MLNLNSRHKRHDLSHSFYFNKKKSICTLMFTSIVVKTYEIQVSKHKHGSFRQVCHGIPEV